MAEVSSNLAIEQEEEGRIERDTEEGEDLDVVKVMETIAPSALLSTVSSFGTLL